MKNVIFLVFVVEYGSVKFERFITHRTEPELKLLDVNVVLSGKVSDRV